MYRQSSSPLLVVAFRDLVFGLDRTTGEVRWRAEPSLNMHIGPVEIAVSEDTVIACSARALTFIDYATGVIRKHVVRADVAVGEIPVMLVDGDHIFLTGSGKAVCYTRDGALLWQQPFKGEGHGSVSLGVPHRVRHAEASR